MTPEVFADTLSAWITAIAAVVEMILLKVGLLVAAYYALILSVQKKDSELKAEIQAIKERQDRHSSRLTDVALAVQPQNGEPQQVEIVQTPDNPTVQVEEV